MTTITIERTILDRLIEAWDSTVLPTHRDGMMQERMEDLRAELAKPVKASQTASQLAATVLADCGISTDCTALLMVVAARIAQHEVEMIDNLKKLAKPVEQQLPDWHDAPTCAGLWTCQHIDDFSATIFNDYEVANFVEPVELENCRWYGPIPQDAAIAKAEGDAIKKGG